jgi:peptidoglycan/xylan/chitin deacetylase (PgdA/CDA1 family)
MILILTYHKVVREVQGRPKFYTIRADQLERQLELLAGGGFESLSPEQLVDHKDPSRNAYILSFDDGTEDHYEVVMPVLARYKQRAIFFVPTAKIDRPGYLQSETIQKMSRAGHVIGSHSHEHSRMDWLVEEDIRVQLELSQQRLSQITGQPPLIFAPPGGYITRKVRDTAIDLGIRAIRTMKWGYNPHPDFVSLDCIPVNRHLTEMEFTRILEFRDMALLYRGKQITKKLLPMKLYESVRESLFGMVGRK